jgi:hypothetical protein
MRYQELLFSASVLGAAIALHNCRHLGKRLGARMVAAIKQRRVRVLGNALHARAFVGPMTTSERYAELAEFYGQTKLQARDDFSRHLLRSLEETYRGLAEGAALLERSSQVPRPEKPASAKSA